MIRGKRACASAQRRRCPRESRDAHRLRAPAAGPPLSRRDARRGGTAARRHDTADENGGALTAGAVRSKRPAARASCAVDPRLAV
ncbi:hypothetical protein GSH05_32945 [Burkholderia pseudomallei]|uniref:Uncharacterized protein n=3 Tax=Burkholderia mallei TaxID=13373 RepID=A2S3L0_BURM9|nr:hypothetical protein BMA0823 [Burkholderia mallei ATCC 23344]ABN00813.1 conserved hypothetical protein [Burkholderia mallei NCTC 10229]ARK98582.1 hypothetical protein BOC43_30935 [Burkholderia pseudomallei]EBA45937.1 conserved hypothetical protein [Burkholderia pseudomallei 305]EDK60318.1 conserved hypothetical protein [Burkholderia mallei JHU]PNX02672.1 hypothetical protein CF649_14525 [Burkholderia sp. 136(2017)]PNX16575.1 hypothetical protein CF650_06880 [Burkholderia sp. 129]PNX29037.